MFWLKVILVLIGFSLLTKLIIFLTKSQNGGKIIKHEPILSDEYSRVDAEIDTEDEPGIVSISIMAGQGLNYSGYEFLQAILDAGLRYGDMNIFHKYENNNENGRVLFSLAQAVSPGTFDLSDVGAISAPGLTLFMEVVDKNQALDAFDIMIDTAKQLVENLGGKIYDAKRCVLDEEGIEVLRGMITEHRG